MKPQADYATDEQVRHHIEMQRKYGEMMSCDDDEPTWGEIIFTGVVVIAAVIAWAGTR